MQDAISQLRPLQQVHAVLAFMDVPLLSILWQEGTPLPHQGRRSLPMASAPATTLQSSGHLSLLSKTQKPEH